MKYLKIRPRLVLLILMIGYHITSQGQQTTNSKADSIEVMNQVNHFLDSFTNLDWNNFTDCFSANATAFFPPSAKTPKRANNKAEVESMFRKVFESARARRSSPPYLDIHPLDTRITVFDATAIVTFHLDDPGMFGRRTIVFRKENRTWKIIHLHASGIAQEN